MAARLTAYVVVGIVAATLIAGLIVGAQRDDSDGPIDIIIHNAKVYTANAKGTMAEAVAIRGNQILRVGSEREVMRLRRPQTTMIDARGAAVLPGFNDAHANFLAGGSRLDGVDLSGAETVDEIQARIKGWVELHADARWVVGRGWYYQPFQSQPGGLPTRQQLDALVPNRPAQLLSYDGHAAWVNTRALKLAGITKKTTNPPNGIIVKDPRTGEPTGVLEEAAVGLVSRHLPATTHADRLAALRAAVEEAHRNGVTSVQNSSGNADEFEIYSEARRDGDLLVRVYSALSAAGALSDSAAADLNALLKQYPDDPLFKVGAVSFTLDGSVETRTAALLESYANDTTTGLLTIDPDDLNKTVRLLDKGGWQVVARASGDRAVRLALNAFEHAVRSNPLPERGRRHRIEHVELVDPDDLPRFGALGVIASMQPFRGNPSATQIDVWVRNVGADRAATAWPYGSISAAAGRVTFGSDWPVVPLSPMLGLHTAVTRTTPDGLPEDGWYPSERLALKAAIDAYTAGAAWASFDEQRKGTLAAGMLADLVVLSDNIFDAPPSRLASTRIATTIFDGKVVYRRDGATTN
jgi:predicted amidohydrolase YtcJ